MAYINPGRQYEQKEFLVGLAAGATWHTPVALTSAIMDFVENVNFPIVGPARIPDPGIGRKFPMYNPSLGKIECKGDLGLSAITYGQATKLFANAFGKDTVTGPAETSAYTHTLSIEASIWDKFLCLAYLFRGVDVVEFPSVKFNQFEISCNPGEVAKGKFNGLADYACTAVDDVRAGACSSGSWTPTVGPGWKTNQWVGLFLVVDAGSVAAGTTYPITANTGTVITATGVPAVGGITSAHIGGMNAGGAGGTLGGAVSSPDFGDRLHFDDLLVRIGGPGGSSLTSGEDFNVGATKVTFERPQTGDFRSPSTNANSLSKHSIWQPRDTGICKMGFEFTFPNYDAQIQELFKYWISTAPQSRRIELLWTSSLLAGATTIPYSFKIISPANYISGNPVNLPQSGGMPVTLKFEASLYSDATSPTIVIVNKETTAQI